MHRVVMGVLVTVAALAGCAGSDEFDGTSLVYPDDFPISTTKDLMAGDMGGFADWYEVSGVPAGGDVTVSVGLATEGDDLSFTVVKTADDFGPDNDYCHGLAQPEDPGPSCTFTVEGDVFYMYVVRGFLDDETTHVDYTLSVSASP